MESEPVRAAWDSAEVVALGVPVHRGGALRTPAFPRLLQPGRAPVSGLE